ncbi:hypothetical protein Rsub_04411 [Raphidocelis subcapitata]|uniref:Uncharacterized protein n=1 Tax=Raphidocelis subcapitata TaxID=307507 RepID=A0A2V0NWP9_9CHLO|nr:hypothetical protein Rsub_04411 [Raphidocelis subcapitata]|eukprot:GBF92064.1 hypothetical protein Rsub_04411 [Raphidocelis subcapitata]
MEAPESFYENGEVCHSLGGIELSEGALSLRNVEAVLLTAQQQHLRHLRRLQNMRRQAELTVAMHSAWQEKQIAEERRRAQHEAELKQRQAERAAQSREVEERNAAAQEAAKRVQEMWRSAIAEKLDAAKDRTEQMLHQRSLLAEFHRVQTARIEARRRRTYANRERALEERRRALLEKEAQEIRHLEQQQELKLIQEEIKKEEEALASVRREDARQRAEAEAEERALYYALKAEQRDRQLAERKQDSEYQRAVRAEEARQRAAYNQQRAAHAAAIEEARRGHLAVRLEGKMAKVETIMGQREALVREVKHVQLCMARQEQRMRSALETMQRTGKWELPADILDTAAALEAAMANTFAPAAALSREASYSISGRSSPQPQRPATPPGIIAETRVFKPCGRAGPAPPSPVRSARQEAELQRVLEEEIVREMEREQALSEEPDHEARKRLLRQFAEEREAAKARILAVGSREAEAQAEASE